MKKRWDETRLCLDLVAEQAGRPLAIRARQLYHDREEITVFAAAAGCATIQRRFRAADAGVIALVLAWRGHPSPERDRRRFHPPFLLCAALLGALPAGRPWAQPAVPP